MIKQVRREGAERVPGTTIAKSVSFDALKSRINRPRHEGELFMSRLLMNDSRHRLKDSYHALKNIRYLGQQLEESMEFLTRLKEKEAKV